MPPVASVDVPASSANLGSGFDSFAAALSLKLRAELWVGDETGIVLNARGEGAPRDDEPADDNLLIRAFREGLRASAAPGADAWRLDVSSMIPSARGPIAVRADRTKLSRTPLPAGDTVLPATVRGVEYQGTYVLLTLAAEPVAEFSVVLSEAEFDAAPWSPGDSACAHWRADDVHPLAA